MRKISFWVAIFSTIGSVFAQNQNDVLRYSQNFYSGTSRFVSMGGAFGALGGDLSSLSTNPAGVGVYQRTEMSFSPNVNYTQSTSQFSHDNNIKTDNSYNFNLNNIGMVAAYSSDDTKGWVGAGFGFTYNRMNDFANNMSISGKNTESSMLDYFKDMAWGNTTDQLWEYREKLAFDAYLIDLKPGTDKEYDNALFPSSEQGVKRNDPINITQIKTIESRGGMGEYAFSFGANYSHMLYLGATLGIQNVKYTENSYYTEKNHNFTDDNYSLDYFTFTENLNTRGTGLNMKFGLIVKPLQWVRIGAALHTPTFYSLTDEYNTKIESRLSYFDAEDGFNPDFEGIHSYTWTPVDNQKNDLDANIFEYQVSSPMKSLLSAGFVIGKIGMVGLDFEMVDYASMRISSDDSDFSDVNDAIQNNYKTTSNIRLGGEIRFAQVFSGRLGASYYGSPYKDTSRKGERTSLSGGLGINSGSFYIDFAYVYTMYSNKTYLYDVLETEKEVSSTNDIDTRRFMFTMGVRF